MASVTMNNPARSRFTQAPPRLTAVIRYGLSPYSLYPYCDVCGTNTGTRHIHGRWYVHQACHQANPNLRTLNLPPLNYAVFPYRTTAQKIRAMRHYLTTNGWGDEEEPSVQPRDGKPGRPRQRRRTVKPG